MYSKEKSKKVTLFSYFYLFSCQMHSFGNSPALREKCTAQKQGKHLRPHSCWENWASFSSNWNIRARRVFAICVTDARASNVSPSWVFTSCSVNVHGWAASSLPLQHWHQFQCCLCFFDACVLALLDKMSLRLLKKNLFHSFYEEPSDSCFYLQSALSGSTLSARTLQTISCSPLATLQMFVSETVNWAFGSARLRSRTFSGLSCNGGKCVETLHLPPSSQTDVSAPQPHRCADIRLLRTKSQHFR